MRMSKEKFCDAINQLRAAHDLKERIDNMIFTEVDVESDFLSGYGMSIDHAGLVVELLEMIMEDDDLISWWCWEMNFGRDCEEDSFSINKKSIDVSTAEKLYDFLIDYVEGKYREKSND